MRGILASGDPALCTAACEAYSRNERNDARINPVRGSSRRTQYLRSGLFSYKRRYNRLYAFLENICSGGFCADLASK